MDFIDACIAGVLNPIVEAADAIPKNRKGREKLRDGINKLIEHNHYDTFIAFCTKDLYDFINLYGWDPCIECAEFNRMDMLTYSHDTLCNKTKCVNDVIEFAAKNNNFEMMEYITSFEEIAEIISEYSSDKDEACTSAAKYNRMEMFTYLHQKGFQMSKLVCMYAAENNNLAMLQYFRENGCEWDVETIEYACKGGHFQLVMYLHENGCPWDQRSCIEASRQGHLNILTYLHENGCPWTAGTISAACNSDDPENIECLEYAYNHGCEMDHWAAIKCGLFGSSKCLDFILSKNAPLTIFAISEATKQGNLEMVIKLRHHGCPWDARVTYWARKEGHNAIYDYAIANNCPLPGEDYRYAYCAISDYYNVHPEEFI